MDHITYSPSLKPLYNHHKPKITNYNHINEKIILSKKCMSQNSSFNTKTSLSLLANIINPPLHPSVDPKKVFTGNFAPVDELGPAECPVIDGKLPSSVTGTYIRNGPNPQHMPINGPLHFFEGDGMLHSVQLSNGRAIYSSRYVKTYKYNLERDAGCQIFPNMLSGFYGIADLFNCVVAILRVFMGHINLKKGFGLANTSLAFFSSKLLALGESDLPYIMNLTQEGDIKTLGRWDFDKNLFANMTAHPKTDMDTKETFAFKCSPMFPYLTFFCFDENGVKQKDVPILSMDRPTFIHDFAITKRFAIFSETQLAVSAENVMLGKGMPVVFDQAKVPRIGIIVRHASTSHDDDDQIMKWFSVPGFNAMHVINAWEEGEDEIVLIAPNAISMENTFRRIDKVHFSLEKVRINTRTGDVSRNILSTRNLEMGSINSSYIGKKIRYVFLGIGKEIPKMSGVVKIDLERETEVSRRFYGPGCFGGEPLFVPRNDGADEDDGFVVTYIHDEASEESKFVIMDAKSPNLDIVAAVKLPRRVPYGFHGLFVYGENHSNA